MKRAKRSLCLDLSLWVRGPKTSIGLVTEKLSRELLRLALERKMDVEVFSRDSLSPETQKLARKVFGELTWAPWTRRWRAKVAGQVFLSFDHRTLPVRGARRAIVVHDAWTLRDNPWQSPEFQRKQRPKVLASLAVADLVICPSEATLSEAKAYTVNPNSRFVHIPWGPMVDAEKEFSQEGFSSRTLVMVANFERRKNHAWACRLAKSLGSEWKWIFVGGDGYGATESRSLVKELTTQGYDVQSLQKLSEIEMRKVYQEAHAVICPSFEEGFGLTVLEALRLGRPAWVSSIAPHREIAGNAVHSFDPLAQDLSGVASEIVATSQNESEYERQVAAGRARAQEFSWPKAGEALFAALERL